MGNVTAKVSGEIASFMSPSMTNIKSLKVHFSPKQLGTGDPSPENVREIEGWDGVEVNGSGKNIAHIVGYSASTVNVTRTRQISNKYGTILSTVDFALPDTKLVVTQSQYPNTDTKHSYQNGYFLIIIDNLVFDKKYNISFKIDNITNNPLNATLKSIFLGRPSGSQTNPSEVDGNRLIFKNIPFNQKAGYPLQKYLEIRNCGMSFTLSEFMVTPVDDEDFEYKPYQGTIDTINWFSDIGTVYGGYVDLISGELVETHNIITFDGSDDELITHSSNFNDWVQLSGIPNMKKGSFFSDNSSVSNRAKKVSSSSNKNELQILIGADNSKVYIYNVARLDSTVTTDETLRNWFLNNPITFTYPLETPIIHQLTPTQLSSFIGQNNFWSNADYVEIEYELKETEDIQKARKKIMLNQPHIESVKDDLINFTTNMKAPLKECKVYFEPVQEGSGDPSPDNVRNITGWDGVNIGLPSEYQEVEYIECDGNGQYIDTNHILNKDNFQIICDFAKTKHTTTEQPLFSIWTSSFNYWNCFVNANKYLVCYTGGHNRITDAYVNENEKHRAILKRDTNTNNWELSYDEYKITWTYNSNRINDTTLKLLKRGDLQGYPNYKIFSFILKIDDFIVANYIPCYRKSDGEIGMYDIVSKTFYTNSGTGTFSKGDDVNTIIGNVNWSDDVGTVHGGYVDLTKGELVATQVGVRKKLSEANYKGQNSNGVYQYNFNFAIPYGQILNKNSQKCNICKYSWNMSDFQQNHFFGYYNESTGNRFLLFLLEDHGLSDDAEIDFMSELTSPVTFKLTPQQLLTFKGENNIWSDTNGQTEVKFWTH